jgi:hypothetical protein
MMAGLKVSEIGVLQRRIDKEDLLTVGSLENPITVAVAKVRLIAALRSSETNMDDLADLACPNLDLSHLMIPVSTRRKAE